MKQFDTVKVTKLHNTSPDFQRLVFFDFINIQIPSITHQLIQLSVFLIVGFLHCYVETVVETVSASSILFGAVVSELDFKLNSTDMKYPYKSAILNNQNGNLNKRWSISFWVYSVNEGKKIRKYDYSINKYSSVRERNAYAKKRIEAINTLLVQGYHIDNSKPAPDALLSIADALEAAFDACSISHASELSYKSSKKCFINWAEKHNLDNNLIQNFSTKHAYQYRDYLKNAGKVGTTINNEISILRRLWNILIKREYIKLNPWNGLEKEREIITNRNIAYRRDEISNLVEVIRRKDIELFHFISMMYHTLARPNEIRQLQVHNIHLNKKKIYFEASKTKSKVDRWINIHDSLIDTLIELIKNKSSNEFLFPGSVPGKPVSKNRMTARHREFLKHLELDNGEHTLYSWKHTGVVLAYEAGVDIKSIQRQCGHSSITETDNYLKSLGLYDNHEITLKQPRLPC